MEGALRRLDNHLRVWYNHSRSLRKNVVCEGKRRWGYQSELDNSTIVNKDFKRLLKAHPVGLEANSQNQFVRSNLSELIWFYSDVSVLIIKSDPIGHRIEQLIRTLLKKRIRLNTA